MNPASAATMERIAGAFTIAAAAAGIGAFVWLTASLFVPLAYAGRPLEYVFIGASPWLLAGAALSAAALLSVLQMRLVRAPSHRWSRPAVRWMTPLALLGAALFSGAALLPGVADRASAIVYVFGDLRPWWSAALVGAALARLDAVRDGPWRRAIAGAVERLTPAGRLFALDAALVLLLFACAIASSQYLRFTAVLHGDEPKYLRLCENIYQGRGLDVEGQQTLEELSLAYSPPLWRNAVRFVEAIRADVGHLRQDARIFLNEGLSFRYNRAQFVEGWFLRGRNGGFYQVHNPGLSLVLFPAYFLDRHFVSTSADYQDIFPAQLPMTNLACVLLYVCFGLAVFRLLVASTGRRVVAWLLAATAMLTMPVAAFPFQIYPEVTAGAIAAVVCRWLLFRDVETRRGAIAAGMLAAFMPWLHVRFIVLSAVLAVWGIVSAKRTRTAFAAAYILVLLALCLYAYHLTGSMRPDAMYHGEGSASPWRLRDALQAFVSFPLDRIWGFLPHAPVYLFAIPGWAIVARVQPGTAALLALLIASLVVSSAGHGFTAAGATPLRHLVAVVPLATVAAAWTLIRWGHRAWVRVAFGILLVVSLDAAFSYNFHHRKEVGRMVDWALSGWTPNLLFPWTHGTPWADWRGTFVLFLIWGAIISGLLVVSLVLVRRPVRSNEGSGVHLQHAVAGVVLFTLCAVGATALGGEWTRTDYFVPIERARLSVITHVADAERCRICYSTVRGEVGRANVLRESPPAFSFEALRAGVRVGERAGFRAVVTVPEGPGWGTLAVDFGDGRVARTDILGSADVAHTYTRTGEYRVTARFTPHAGTFEQRAAGVTALPAVVDPAAVRGASAALMQTPARRPIERVLAGSTGVGVRLARREGDGAAKPPSLEDPLDVSVLVWDGRYWNRHRFSGGSTPADGAWVAVIAVEAGGESRTEPAFFRWPPAAALIGAPAAVFP